MAEDIVLTILKEMRAEIGERFGRIDRTLAGHGHRLNLLRAALASLKAGVATLASTVPVLHERFDQIEARVTAIEARLPA
jgi:hypothetical protein